VIGECLPRHRSREFIRFLTTIDRQTPPDLDLHLIVDNSTTHKRPPVHRWLQRHPRFHLHFIPTSSSWLNMVERWFGEITRKRIRRGTFRRVKELVAAITDYLSVHNQAPTRFVWTKRRCDPFHPEARARTRAGSTSTRTISTRRRWRPG
jgi:transposase